MLGDTIRAQRIRKGLTQAKLARLATVSRRHLAALEKGANVSIAVLKKVAAVLDLNEINLGSVTLQTGSADPNKVNVPLLADTLREARAAAAHHESLLARAETLLGSEGATVSRFPLMPIRRLDNPRAAARQAIADGTAGMSQVDVKGEIRQGEPVDETATGHVSLPSSVVEDGEVVFRARGERLRDQGIEDGDLLIVQLRPKGRAATGELVIGRIGDAVYIGRWWQKHDRKALMSDGLSEVTTGAAKGALKVVAVINTIIRPA